MGFFDSVKLLRGYQIETLRQTSSINFRFIVRHYEVKRVEVELHCRFEGFNLQISVYVIVLAVVLTT